jgi:hypothetical protein
VSGNTVKLQFADWWDSFVPGRRIALWNLVEPLGKHPAGSSLSSLSLKRLGFDVEPLNNEELENGKIYVVDSPTLPEDARL